MTFYRICYTLLASIALFIARPFTHHYRNELWSNGFALTLQTRKKAK
jgi:hypothetical protein